MYTYRDLIRKYSADVSHGACDIDLTVRQRRMVAVLLNLASNYGGAVVAYPPTDATRDATRKYIGDIVWNAGAGALVRATSPNAADDFSAATDAALLILTNI